jgi:hypothetical protein
MISGIGPSEWDQIFKEGNSMKQRICGHCNVHTAALVTLETMPDYLKESHIAAGNSGSYPFNGAQRERVCPTCATEQVAADPLWSKIVRR